MVAETCEHYDRHTLRALLDDALPPAEADLLQRHLAGCGRCQASLERVAGDAQWWSETRSVLADSTLAPASSADVQPSEAALDGDGWLLWVRPLMAPPQTDGEWGRLDGHPIHGIVGQGGMGVVLCGWDPQLQRKVAIKVLAPHLAGVGAARQRFMREAQAAAAVVHPSIVPIYAVASAARLPYLVMPLIAGGNLQQRIDRDGALELSEVLRIGLQVAEGLAAAHRHALVHRDIKPANILLEDGNRRVLISDFGLARALDDATLTASGMLAGTPQYMSPEQAAGNAVDARSDLFSLGGVLYATATGRPPFAGDSPLAVIRQIGRSAPKPASQINEQLPRWFDRLVDRLMQADRNHRPRSAEDVARLISDCLAHVRDPHANRLPAELSATQTIRRRRQWLVGGLLLLTMAVIAVLAMVVLRPSFEPPEPPTPTATAPPVVDDAAPSQPVAEAAVVDDARAIESQIEAIAAQVRQLAHEMAVAD